MSAVLLVSFSKMLFLKVKWQHLLIAVVSMDVLLYLAFVMFLKVTLPKGILI